MWTHLFRPHSAEQAGTTSSSSFTLSNPEATITMSFGFGVGDFIAVIQLVNKIRADFIGAPSQFRSISNVYVYGLVDRSQC
jgi:hypothetical protein